MGDRGVVEGSNVYSAAAYILYLTVRIDSKNPVDGEWLSLKGIPVVSI